MTRKQQSNKVILYSGNSLETYLSIKSKLEINKIKFIEQAKSNDNFWGFIYKLFIVGRGSLGLPYEHETKYTIYVKTEDYDKAKQLLN